MMVTHDDIWQRVTMHDDDLQLEHMMTNDNGWQQWWLLSAAESN